MKYLSNIWFALFVLVFVIFLSIIFDFPFFAYFIVLCILAPFLMMFWSSKIQPKIDQEEDLREKLEGLNKMKSEFKPIIINNLKGFKANDFKANELTEKTTRNLKIKSKKRFKNYEFFELNEFKETINIGLITVVGYPHLLVRVY